MHSAATRRKKFTSHQLFAVLSLKTFPQTDHVGVVAFLKEFSERRKEPGLKKVPQYSTVCYVLLAATR